MSNDTPDVVVLRSKAHGISTKRLARALRERLSGANVVLASTPHEERELVSGTPVIAGLDIDAEIVEAALNLRYFACASAGTGHLPMEELAERGVAVTNASGVHVPNIAEHVLGWMLMIGRRLDEGLRRQQNREWRHFQAFGELEGSTVTVVGLGALGTSIADRLEAFNVDTIGVRYTPEKGGPTDEVIGFESKDLHEAYSRTDYLVIACPLSDTTRGMIDTEVFETLPTDAIVINVGRGPIIDTDALLGALQRNKIHTAALDVTDPEPLPEDHPLWTLENVLITPHVSGHTAEYWNRVADIVAENIHQTAETGEYRDLTNQVVAPE